MRQSFLFFEPFLHLEELFGEVLDLPALVGLRFLKSLDLLVSLRNRLQMFLDVIFEPFGLHLRFFLLFRALSIKV